MTVAPFTRSQHETRSEGGKGRALRTESRIELRAGRSARRSIELYGDLFKEEKRRGVNASLAYLNFTLGRSEIRERIGGSIIPAISNRCQFFTRARARAHVYGYIEAIFSIRINNDKRKKKRMSERKNRLAIRSRKWQAASGCVYEASYKSNMGSMRWRDVSRARERSKTNCRRTIPSAWRSRSRS